ncbi:hypothetical protein [Kribbella italica]|uniref:Uncharacterized protein n=1 Tax=Kribbella italica TaxID=1540520 RepID=A0A7W9MRX6_9ACTN|nr:hypothetical protein [Kribbella italica]MBB5833999.1 hypothetical protein [Kribbella italica]
MRITKKAVAGISALALAGGGGILVMSSADAAQSAPQPSVPAARDAGGSIPNAKGAVTNWHLGKGSVYGDNLGPGMVEWFTTVYNGSVHEIGLDANLKNQLGNGKGTSATFAPKAIEKIGGPFAANKTTVGELKLPAAGTYLVNTQAKFDRKDAGSEGYVTPTTDTYPSLVVRYDGDSKDAGTIMGSPVSKAGFVELTGSSTATVTVTGPTTLKVYGFGYNEDRSAFGAGQITVSGQATAVKIG